MSPFLYEYRDRAIFTAVEGHKVKRGDIVFYQRDGGQYVMHRVYKVEKDGVMTMLGDAQWTLEAGIRPDQIRAFVPRVVRKGREISCTCGVWHFLMKMYLWRIRFPRAARFGLRVLNFVLRMKKRIRMA